MIIGIMQPTFLPWIGYFQMIAQSDVFVFLDDVQFRKRSWQRRNRVLSHSNEIVQFGFQINRKPQKTDIKDITYDQRGSWESMVGRIENALRKTPFLDDFRSLLSDLVHHSTNVCDSNIWAIKEACRRLRIHTQFVRSSELDICSSNKVDRLIVICRHFQASTYLSAQGSRDYLENDNNWPSDIQIRYFEPRLIPYEQAVKSVFVSHMSIGDAIANLGWDGISHKGLV